MHGPPSQPPSQLPSQPPSHNLHIHSHRAWSRLLGATHQTCALVSYEHLPLSLCAEPARITPPHLCTHRSIASVVRAHLGHDSVSPAIPSLLRLPYAHGTLRRRHCRSGWQTLQWIAEVPMGASACPHCSCNGCGPNLLGRGRGGRPFPCGAHIRSWARVHAARALRCLCRRLTACLRGPGRCCRSRQRLAPSR